MGCFSTILFLGGFVMVMVTFIRWFEQTAEAVDNGWWNKIFILLACPFTVWLFPSRVNAGRATAVPRHEPVRGFGSVPKTQAAPQRVPQPALQSAPQPAPVSPRELEAERPAAEAAGLAAAASDQPPLGTPKEFLGLPKIPPSKPRAKPSVDPDKVAKLKQKMREQGMLPPDEE